MRRRPTISIIHPKPSSSNDPGPRFSRSTCRSGLRTIENPLETQPSDVQKVTANIQNGRDRVRGLLKPFGK